MSEFQGFGELKRPKDLVRKLGHDLERMENSPQDQYPAFDFFVTAEHIVDWIYPDSRNERKALRENTALLRITSHIANGAKHFEAKAKHHKSVSGIKIDCYVEAGYVEEDYFQDPLIVHLTPEEEKSFGVSDIEAISLARRVLDYWRESEKLA